MTPSVADLIAELHARGVVLPPGSVRLDHYGDSAELSRKLLALIRSGHKRAGTGLLWWHEHEGEPIPQVGDIEIVLTHDDRPSVITRVTRVEVLPYREVSAEYAAIEGEGDASLDFWRQSHWRSMSRPSRSSKLSWWMSGSCICCCRASAMPRMRMAQSLSKVG